MQQANQIDLDIRVLFVQFTENKRSQLQHETISDTELSTLSKYIVEARLDYYTNLTANTVCRQSMQPDVLAQIHAAHQGVDKFKLRARRHVFWNNKHRHRADGSLMRNMSRTPWFTASRDAPSARDPEPRMAVRPDGHIPLRRT